MRQINFRAWDNVDWKMYEGHSVCLSIDGAVSFLTTYGEWEKDDDRSRIELMQFTGLTDKNGKEIYYGDIVKGKESGYENISIKGWDGYRIGEVVFKDGNTYYTVNGQIHQLLMHLQDCLILGNKFENPELLK